MNECKVFHYRHIFFLGFLKLCQRGFQHENFKKGNKLKIIYLRKVKDWINLTRFIVYKAGKCLIGQLVIKNNNAECGCSSVFHTEYL